MPSGGIIRWLSQLVCDDTLGAGLCDNVSRRAQLARKKSLSCVAVFRSFICLPATAVRQYTLTKRELAVSEVLSSISADDKVCSLYEPFARWNVATKHRPLEPKCARIAHAKIRLWRFSQPKALWPSKRGKNRGGAGRHATRRSLQLTPPEYDLSKIRAKIHLFTSAIDVLSTPEDVDGYLIPSLNPDCIVVSGGRIGALNFEA